MKRSSKITAMFAAVVMAATAVPAAAFAQDAQAVTAGTEVPGAKIDISKLEIYPIQDQVYWGEPVKPVVQIDLGDGSEEFAGTSYDKDFSVSYKNNDGVGTASMTITGKRKYTGTVTLEFNIIPRPVNKLDLSHKDGAVTLSWDKVEGVSKYYVYYSVNGSDFKKLATTKKCTYVNKKLDPKNNTYEFFVAPAKKVNKKTYINKNSGTTALLQELEKCEFDGIKVSGKVIDNQRGSATLIITGFDFAKYMKKATSKNPCAVIFGMCGTTEFWSMNNIEVLFDKKNILHCTYGGDELKFKFDKSTNTLAMILDGVDLDMLRKEYMYVQVLKFNGNETKTLALVGNFKSESCEMGYGGYADMTVEWDS